MAVEKFIRGKRDNCKHDGLYSIRKREQQADYLLKHWQEESATIDLPVGSAGLTYLQLTENNVIFMYVVKRSKIKNNR